MSNKPFFSKDLEGQNVFLVPTGNNVARYGNRCPFSQSIEVTIVKVTSKFVTFSTDGSRHETKYRINDCRENWLNQSNSGYEVYLTKEALDAYFVKTKVQNKLRNFGVINDMTPEQAAGIAKVMGWEL